MPRLSEETITAGDQSWLASTHGIWECRSVAPDPEAFNATDYPSGVPSGTPLAIVEDLAVPFDPDGDGGEEVLAGFLFTDQKAPAEGAWPLLDHGKVRVNKLPSAVRTDVSAAAAAANPYGLIAFVDRAMTAPVVAEEGS